MSYFAQNHNLKLQIISSGLPHTTVGPPGSVANEASETISHERGGGRLC